jgi:hypothetical protein
MANMMGSLGLLEAAPVSAPHPVALVAEPGS